MKTFELNIGIGAKMNTAKIKTLSILALLTCVIALAATKGFAMSPVEDDSTRPSIGRSGELFTLQFSPGKRSITIGLAGKPALTMDSARVTVFGRVFPVKGEPKALKIVPVESHFEIVDELQPHDSIELEIKDHKTKKSEKFKIDHHQP
jgi:hypothetical protein